MHRASFSEYIIYADESGDTGLTRITPDTAIFVLVFCIFKKTDYYSIAKQSLAKLKFDFWGHDLPILHSSEIRKQINDFNFLVDEEIRRIFLNRLNEIIRSIPFTIIPAAINKNELERHQNPYFLALASCMEQTYHFLESLDQSKHLTHIVFENRGLKEDKELHLEFKKIANLGNLIEGTLPFDIQFANKKTNNYGLQLADLVAHPIARHLIKKDQPNKAFDIIKEKVYHLESIKPRQLSRLYAGQEPPTHDDREPPTQYP